MENQTLIDIAKRVLSGSSEPDVRISPRTYSELGSTQKHRYNYLLPLFGGQTMTLVPLIEGRGKNSWIKVSEKIDNLIRTSYDEQSYHDALYDTFEIGKTYTPGEVVGVVAEVRRKRGLKPYASRIKINCEADFFNLYIIHDVYTEEEIDGEVKKTLTGYIPMFKLKPEE